MSIEIRIERNGVHVKRPCVACGLWERPDDPAFRLYEPGDTYGHWICDGCASLGPVGIQGKLLERAETHRRIAASYEEAAQKDITLPDEAEVERLRAEAHRQEEEREEEYLRRIGVHNLASVPLSDDQWEDPPF